MPAKKTRKRTISPPSTNLYHYTNQKGLLGITESLELWATKIQYFNDGQELELGLDLARRRLSQMLKEESSHDPRLIKAFGAAVDQVNTINKFVVSFSTVGDSLGQWRAYCKVGDGFCIGVDRSALEALVRSERWRVVECVYEPRRHHETIGNLVDRMLQMAERRPGNDEEVAWRFVQRLADTALGLKNSSFAEEQEVRLVSPTISERKGEIRYRSGRYTLCPFVALRLGSRPEEFPIERVVVGPTPYSDLSIQATAALLRKHHLEQAWVFRSRSSYRLW